MAFEEKYVKQRTNKFRGPTGQRLTKGLFVEFYGSDKSKCLYTLEDVDKVDPDGNTYQSLYQAYMEMGDLYERDFALKYFESWDHWDEIRNSAWMSPILAKWRKELELQIRSEALMRIQMEASGHGKNAYNANIYLARRGWLEDADKPIKTGKGAGRPSKAQIAEETARLAMEAHDVSNDLKRLGLN